MVPAGFLVLIILGAIAVDTAIVVMAQRDLANRTAAAANDIAGLAVSDEAFYGGAAPGSVALVPERAAAYVALAFPPDRPPAGYLSWSGQAVTDGRQVVVTASAEVRYLFAPAIPGVDHTTTVTARSEATARGG
ncbi:MAG TPA: hypothetical protein VFO65_02210 [Acidimicrobiales bacterium]|nr:hypothetical protein [Acidimicrobiales bacterium]